MSSTTKSLPLTKEEVQLLLQLIENEKVVTIKTTNYATNQMKDAAWLRITETFNDSVSSYPRTTAQLRLKWENLKKAARKRSASIRQSQILKTGGGKLSDIPSGDTLDRVTTLLDSTCDGNIVEFVRDSDPLTENLSMVVPSTGQGSSSSFEVYDDSSYSSNGSSNSKKNCRVVKMEDHIEQVTQPMTKTSCLNTPNDGTEKLKRKAVMSDIKARTTRNIAIAEYYQIKKKKLEIELECNKLNLNKIKLQLENTKIENMTLKAKIHKLNLK